MKSSVDVFLRLHGQRKFSKELAASGAELEAMGLKGAQAMTRFAASGEKLKRFGRSWTRNVSTPILGFGVVSGKFALDFDRAMRNVNSIAQLPEGQLHHLENSVLNLAGPTAQAPLTLAEGLYDLVSSGFNAKEGLVVLRKSALAATAGLTSTEVATKAVAAVINAYGLKASASGRISDQLFETVNRGVLTFEELASTVGDVLPFASQLDVGLNQVGSAVSTMTKAGLSAPETMTRIKNVLVTLLKPGKDLAGVLKDMGTTGEALVKKRGLQGALEALVAQTDGSKTAVAELFPNIRAMGGVLALTGTNAGRAQEDLASFANTAGATNKALSQQSKSVGFKLQQAWAKFQATLIRFGDKVLPKALAAFEALMPYAEKAVHLFASMPLSVQAGAIAFGPLVSVVGYLAGGLGRVLVLMGKVGRASTVFSAVMSPNVMTEASGFRGAFGMASQKVGLQGALQTAKGFAFALGPAVATYGIGNIVTSALDKDWKGAGFEAGGAIAGGIAGFMLGGPLGAMLGVGVGSLGGELLSGLFGSGKRLAPIQEKLARSSREVARYFKEQGEAGVALSQSTQNVASAQARARATSRAAEAAERQLVTTKRQSGASSRATARAEWRLTIAQDTHRQATKRLHSAERVRGQRLQWFKQIATAAVLEERNRIHNLKAQELHIRDVYREERKAGAGRERLLELSKQGTRVSLELAKSQRKYKETLSEAADKAGPKFANFLEKGKRWSLEFGGALKAMNARLRVTKELTQGLSEREPFAIPDLGNLGSGVQGLPAGPRVPKAGPPAPGRPRRTSARGRAGFGPAPLAMRQTRRRGLNGDGALRVDITVHSRLEMDGKTAAESTARHSQRAANRE